MLDGIWCWCRGGGDEDGGDGKGDGGVVGSVWEGRVD